MVTFVKVDVDDDDEVGDKVEIDNGIEHEIKKRHLVILTPCYGGVCNITYTICLIDTIELLKSLNIKVTIEFCRNDSLITRARNNLIGKAMNDLSVTHFLFIDNDLSWNPKDIVSLINSDKEIIGGAYPIKITCGLI